VFLSPNNSIIQYAVPDAKLKLFADDNNLHCVPKKHPRHFQLYLGNQLSNFNNSGTNIPDTTYHQMTIQFPTSSVVCFCTT